LFVIPHGLPDFLRWQDYGNRVSAIAEWRCVQVGLIDSQSNPCQTQADTNQNDREPKSMTDQSFPLRAIKILAEGG